MLSIILNSTNMNGEILWYWEMKSPSGPAACFSPYFTHMEGAAQAARAFIYNINCSGILLQAFDKRIMPTTDPERFDIPFEIYFREVYKLSAPQPQEEPKATIKKAHLSLVE